MKRAKINVNRAPKKDLETLPLIGPKRAEAIVAFRKRNGMFRAADDLDSVPGIGKKIINRIRVYITV